MLHCMSSGWKNVTHSYFPRSLPAAALQTELRAEKVQHSLKTADTFMVNLSKLFLSLGHIFVFILFLFIHLRITRKMTNV